MEWNDVRSKKQLKQPSLDEEVKDFDPQKIFLPPKPQKVVKI